MASKRQHPESGGTPLGGPPSKKTQFEPVRLGPIATLEEMDMKVLQFQNRKLTERLDQRQKQECELRRRIEQLEKRQTTDDAVLCIVNRYWNQLDEDMRVLLQRFDYETSDEAEYKNESEATTSFLTLLSTWDKQELDEKLSQRVQFSKRAVGKLLQTFDRLLQRNEKITLALKGEAADEPLNLDDAVKEANIELQAENGRLQCLVTQLHEKHHTTKLKFADLQDKYNAVETELAELKNRLEDVEYDLAKEQQRSDKLDTHLTEALAKLKNYESDGKDGKPVSVGHRLGGHKMDEQEAEEMKELAANRLAELEKLHQEHKDALKEVEKLKMELQQLPESVILESTEYKCLQSQFSVLYNESMQMKTQLEETRTLLQSSKNAHLRQIEQMESEELAAQKKLRTEVIQLEDTLAQVRKEYEMLRIEFEQTLAANEQTGPINREMRHLITSLQNHNQQLKGEVARYKRKLKESQSELNKVKNDVHKLEAKGNPCGGCDEIAPSTSKEEPIIKKEEDREEDNQRERGKSDLDIIKDLKSQLKLYRKSQEAQKEMKLLLDMYKGVAKEQRDKVQLTAAESKYTQHTLKHAIWKNKLMAAEKRAKGEVEELKSQLRKMQENERKERKKLADDDAIRKIKSLEETIQQLQKNLAATKQEEDALLSEMEVTGQAFEDMQEQNVRLLQQLREKDDANFKLMSERIKSNQIHKLLREEKDILGEQVATLQTQVETQNQVVRGLEEKERILQNNLSTVEKELSLRRQSMEMHKRKAIESAQSAADLKLHLDKYHAQLKEAQSTVADKTGALEQESFKIKRLQEEVASLRRKLERAKKFELAGAADEVLMEEIREYKEQLTCPSCKVKRKDGVLTKCFHVFCFDCLKTRYETRQRKCPKCNAAFGVNDYHRLYLG